MHKPPAIGGHQISRSPEFDRPFAQVSETKSARALQPVPPRSVDAREESAVNCLYACGCFLLASGFSFALIFDRTSYGSNQLAILECITLQLVASPNATIQL